MDNLSKQRAGQEFEPSPAAKDYVPTIANSPQRSNTSPLDADHVLELFPQIQSKPAAERESSCRRSDQSPQKHLGVLNKEYLCVNTCGHHHATERIPRDREEDSVFCVQDDSRSPADIHITVSQQLRNAAGATVNGTNQKPDQFLFSISCTHTLQEVFFCVFSYCLIWRICYFSLFKMQNLNYDLRALCTAEFLAQHPMNVVLPLSVHHLTRDETPKDSGGMAR